MMIPSTLTPGANKRINLVQLPHLVYQIDFHESQSNNVWCKGDILKISWKSQQHQSQERKTAKSLLS